MAVIMEETTPTPRHSTMKGEEIVGVVGSIHHRLLHHREAISVEMAVVDFNRGPLLHRPLHHLIEEALSSQGVAMVDSKHQHLSGIFTTNHHRGSFDEALAFRLLGTSRKLVNIGGTVENRIVLSDRLIVIPRIEKKRKKRKETKPRNQNLQRVAGNMQSTTTTTKAPIRTRLDTTEHRLD